MNQAALFEQNSDGVWKRRLIHPEMLDRFLDDHEHDLVSRFKRRSRLVREISEVERTADAMLRLESALRFR